MSDIVWLVIEAGLLGVIFLQHRLIRKYRRSCDDWAALTKQWETLATESVLSIKEINDRRIKELKEQKKERRIPCPPPPSIN